jgi:hypothetical protein
MAMFALSVHGVVVHTSSRTSLAPFSASRSASDTPAAAPSTANAT